MEPTENEMKPTLEEIFASIRKAHPNPQCHIGVLEALLEGSEREIAHLNHIIKYLEVQIRALK